MGRAIVISSGNSSSNRYQSTAGNSSQNLERVSDRLSAISGNMPLRPYST